MELALVILQDLIANGPTRAKTLKLKVAKTISGGKTIVHPNAKSFERYKDDKGDSDAQIEAAHFSLSDSSGASPEFKFRAGKKLKAPYANPDHRGYFTPKKKANKKSLIKDFEV